MRRTIDFKYEMPRRKIKNVCVTQMESSATSFMPLLFTGFLIGGIVAVAHRVNNAVEKEVNDVDDEAFVDVSQNIENEDGVASIDLNLMTQVSQEERCAEGQVLRDSKCEPADQYFIIMGIHS